MHRGLPLMGFPWWSKEFINNLQIKSIQLTSHHLHTRPDTFYRLPSDRSTEATDVLYYYNVVDEGDRKRTVISSH